MTAQDQWSTNHRPTKPSEYLGQPAAIAYVRGMVKRGVAPSCILITGPSGTGKTTLARLIAALLSGWKGDPDKNPDVRELPANIDRTIENVRAIVDYSRYSPSGGKRRIVIVDEIQALGANTPASGALLKATEDPAPKATWILCTNEPWAIKATQLMRAQKIVLSDVAEPDIIAILENSLKKANVSLGKHEAAVLARIAKLSFGSPREAVQMLETLYTSVVGGGTIVEALKMAVSSASATTEGFQASLAFVQALIAGDEKAAVLAVAGASNADGMVELVGKMVSALCCNAAGSKPKDGLAWAVVKAVRGGELHALLSLQSRCVAALDIRSRYSVPSEALLLSLARKV